MTDSVSVHTLPSDFLDKIRKDAATVRAGPAAAAPPPMTITSEEVVAC